MENLVLIGAGGLGRETAEAVRACNVVEPRWNLLGFLDDGLPQGAQVSGTPVLGPTSELHNLPDTQVVLCTARPDRYWSRKQLVSSLAIPDSRYATIIHPAASIGSSVRMGSGCIVLAGVVATADVEIGSHVAIMPNCVFTHDDKIGSYATFGAGVQLAGEVIIGEGCYLGSGSLVRENISIDSWALIGLGSIVLDNVGSRQVWAGTPARFLRNIDVPTEITSTSEDGHAS